LTLDLTNVFWLSPAQPCWAQCRKLSGGASQHDLPFACISHRASSFTAMALDILRYALTWTGWDCSILLAESGSQAGEETGLLKILGLSSSTKKFLIISLPVHLLGCATASHAVFLRFTVRSMTRWEKHPPPRCPHASAWPSLGRYRGTTAPSTAAAEVSTRHQLDENQQIVAETCLNLHCRLWHRRCVCVPVGKAPGASRWCGPGFAGC